MNAGVSEVRVFSHRLRSVFNFLVFCAFFRIFFAFFVFVFSIFRVFARFFPRFFPRFFARILRVFCVFFPRFFACTAYGSLPGAALFRLCGAEWGCGCLLGWFSVDVRLCGSVCLGGCVIVTALAWLCMWLRGFLCRCGSVAV